MAEYEVIRPRQASWWDRVKRSITLGPWNPRDKEIARYFGGGTVSAGVSVNEETAMEVSAFFSAVMMVSDDIASLPLMLYKRLPNGGKDRFESHPIYRLLHDAPNPEMDSMVFRRTMQMSLMIWQNAYAEIERDGANRPVALWPLLPERVSWERERGQPFYRVRNYQSQDAIIEPADMIHLIGYSRTGNVGDSLVNKARESLGLSIAAERYGAAFFGNGATVGGVVSMDGPRPDERVVKGYREQIEARHQGVERAHKLLLLYNGAKFTPNVIPPESGQFNETRLHQIREVARWFRMPPHKLGDLADATYSNVEQMDAAYLASCIRPYLRLWEQQLTRKLVFPLEQRQQFIEHDTHGFLSVDAASRAALYQSESHIGTITINEIRGYENRDPIDGGNRVFIDLNRIPLDRYDEWIDAEIDSKKARAESDRRPPPEPVVPPAQTDEEKAERHAEELRLARKRAQDAEDAKDLANATLTDVQVLLAQSLEAYEAVDEDRGNVANERDVLAADVSRLTSEIGILETASASLRRALEEEREKVANTAQERDRIARDADGVRSALHQETELHKTTIAECVGALAERDDLARRLAEAEQAAVDLATQRDEQIAAVAAAREEATRAGETYAGLLDASLEDYNAEKAARMQAETKLTDTERALDETLRIGEEQRQARLAAETALLDARNDVVKLTADEHSARTERDMLSADVDTLQQRLDGAELALETERQRTEAQRAIVRAALLEGFQDATDRLLQRESDRARKAQATPEKLRTWAANFYPLYEDVVRAAFRPFAVAWTAVQGGEPLALLDTLVRQHIETSDTAIRQVADVDEPDQMASALERTLARWGAERAQSVAEAILRDGIQENRR